MKKRIIIAGIIVIVAILLWVFVLSRTFLTVTSETGAYRVYKNGIEVASNTSGSLSYLPKGNYTIASIKDGAPTAATFISTTILPWQSETITQLNDADPLRSQLILGRNTTHLTTLGDGYLYKNTETRGIEYVDNNGIKDVSDLFDISSKDISSSSDTYSTVVNIQRGSDAVYLTTTRAIYRLTSLESIEKSQLSDALITRSEVNKETGKIIFITFSGNGTYDAYSLPTANITGRVQQVYTGKTIINSITTAGDSAIIYNNNTPSPGADTADAYSDKKQIEPQLIDLESLKITPVKHLPKTTFVTISLDKTGTYIAYRTKLSDKIIVQVLSTGKQVATLPATTLTQLVWQDDRLIYNYGSVLLSYKPNTDKPTSEAIMHTNDQITDFVFDGTLPIVATNNGFVYEGSKNPNNIAIENFTLESEIEGYTLGFSALGNTIVYRLCDLEGRCDPADTYKKTIDELTKINGSTPEIREVSDTFFISDYSYTR